MTMVSTLPEPESATRPSSSRPHEARPLPLWSRVRHQCTQELRRQWLLVLLMWLLPAASLALWNTGLGYHFLIGYIIGIISLVFSVVLVCRCVWASSASRTEMLVHTQPVGRAALVLAQALFILVAVLIPWVSLDVVGGIGFGYSGLQWFHVVLGSVLMACVPIGLGAAWMSAARTYRQQGVIFMLALMGWWGAVLLFDKMGRGHLFDWLGAHGISSMVQVWVHLFGAGLLGVVLWVVQSLLHRRRLMLYVALGGGLLLAFITLGWPWDWTRADDKPYVRDGRPEPKLVFRDDDTGNQPGTTRLWRGVVVEGLQPKEVAVIASLFQRGSRRPIGFADSDDRSHADRSFGITRMGVEADMARSLSRSLPGGWLISDSFRETSRLPLPQVWKALTQDGSRVPPKDSWIMKLAMVEPRMVAEFPLRELLHDEKRFLLEPGMCVALGNTKNSQAFLELWMQEVERQPILSKTPADREMHFPAGMLARKLYVLFLDDSRKMAHMMVSQALTGNSHVAGPPGTTFITKTLYQTLEVDGPGPRMQLTGLTRDEWISKVRVQIWWPELKGFHSLPVSGTELQQLVKEQTKDGMRPPPF